MAQQAAQAPDPVAALQQLFPHYQAPVSPLQFAQQPIRPQSYQPNFMNPAHVRPNMTGVTPGQGQSINALSAEHLPYLLQMLGRR